MVKFAGVSSTPAASSNSHLLADRRLAGFGWPFGLVLGGSSCRLFGGRGVASVGGARVE